jgi:hypothetical protein
VVETTPKMKNGNKMMTVLEIVIVVVKSSNHKVGKGKMKSQPQRNQKGRESRQKTRSQPKKGRRKTLPVIVKGLLVGLDLNHQRLTSLVRREGRCQR